MGRGRALDLTGQRFGKLVAVGPVKRTGDEHVWWECRCDCGEACLRRADALTSGKSKSCGCSYRKQDKNCGCSYKSKTKSRRLYYVWKSMRYRCERPSDRSYCSYGAKGITVCDEWKDYRQFERWALDNGYDENAKFGACTIDRIDPKKDYSPGNCRFISIQMQEQTRSNNKRITGSDGSYYLSLSACARELKLTRYNVERCIEHDIPIDGVVYRFADQD